MTDSKLAELTLHTSLDAEYKFPDVPEEELKSLVKGVALGAHLNQILVTNVSGACLVVPLRIVNSISINGVKKWQR